MIVALDATYSVGSNLTGVGVYSREIAYGLARAHPEAAFRFCYRPHRLLRSLLEPLPANARRSLLTEERAPREADLFHGLNQRLPRAPLRRAITTFHDLFVMTAEYSAPEFRARFRDQAIEAAGRSERIIAVSEFTAGQVADLLGVERSRLRVVHHGVRAPAQVPPDDCRENVVLHVGAIQVRKNVARLIEAFEQMDPGWRLVLIGSAGYGAQQILRRIEESPRRRAIEWLGYVPAAQRDRWYARARIFAFPSLDEGFGLPVLEAMAWGVPVVAARSSALPEVAAHAAWLVDPLRVEELAGALRSLACDGALRHLYAGLGRDRARNFRWEDAVARTWAVYLEVAGR
ncbi:MAG: glycosyltransferase family 1 protein [Bryobacterales bacterium]|nr:glycosyltransferase family 1 protein [Bryobacterales bacterium]